MPSALVTGATGLIGTHVVQRLQRDGWEVRALVRDAARAGALSRAGIQLATGDVLEPTGLARAARGCDVVFHTAASISADEWESFRRPNVDGTRNVISAAEGAKARLVHVSSVAVYGGAGRYRAGGALTDEETPLATLSERAYYARSKRESEALVMAAHNEGRIWATAVRPCVVYGRHDRQFVPRIAGMLRRGFAPVIGGGKTTIAIVNAESVADGLVRAATTDAAGGRAYNLANDFDVTVEEFFRLASTGMTKRVRMLRLPYVVVKSATALFTPLLGEEFRVNVSWALDFLARDNPFTSERARRELGWDPQVRPENGVPDAFRWWAAHH